MNPAKRFIRVFVLPLIVTATLLFAQCNQSNQPNTNQDTTDSAFARQQTEFQLLRLDLEHLLDPQTQRIKLHGLPINDTAEAIIYWNSTSGNTYVDPYGLPIPETESKYQLWHTDKAGKSTSLGLIKRSTTKHELQRMHNLAEGYQFSITIEPEAGNSYPRLEKMIVSSYPIPQL